MDLAARTTNEVNVNGLPVCYRSDGSGDPVLLIHGFLGSSLSWRQQISVLAAAGWRTLAIDLPGFGDTRRAWDADHSHAAYTEVCAGFLAALGVGPAHIVGHSMGGQVALRLAVRYPGLCRSLTVVDGAIYRTPLRTLTRMPGIVPLLRRLIHRRWRDAGRLRRDLNRFCGFALSDDVFAYLQAHYQELPECRDSVIAHIRDGSPPLAEDRFQQVQVPVHVVWGERDTVFPRRHAERFAEALARSPGPVTVTVIPGVGHFPQEMAAQALNEALLEFLERNRPGHPE